MLNNDQNNNKKVKSAWEGFFFFPISVFGIYMLNESQMFDCEEAAKKKKKMMYRI